MTATGRPPESTTTTRSPGTGSGSFACSYSATSPVVVVFSPAKTAARLQTRDRLKIRPVRGRSGCEGLEQMAFRGVEDCRRRAALTDPGGTEIQVPVWAAGG
jgi:hypothetical protein